MRPVPQESRLRLRPSPLEFLNQSLGRNRLFSVRVAVSVNVFLLGGTKGFLDWPVMKLIKN